MPRKAVRVRRFSGRNSETLSGFDVTRWEFGIAGARIAGHSTDHQKSCYLIALFLSLWRTEFLQAASMDGADNGETLGEDIEKSTQSYADPEDSRAKRTGAWRG